MRTAISPRLAIRTDETIRAGAGEASCAEVDSGLLRKLRPSRATSPVSAGAELATSAPSLTLVPSAPSCAPQCRAVADELAGAIAGAAGCGAGARGRAADVCGRRAGTVPVVVLVSGFASGRASALESGGTPGSAFMM